MANLLVKRDLLQGHYSSGTIYDMSAGARKSIPNMASVDLTAVGGLPIAIDLTSGSPPALANLCSQDGGSTWG